MVIDYNGGRRESVGTVSVPYIYGAVFLFAKRAHVFALSGRAGAPIGDTINLFF